jgi:hypothetical protein
VASETNSIALLIAPCIDVSYKVCHCAVLAGRTATQDSEDSDGSDSDGETERRNQVIDAELRQMNAAKKASFKATFDKKYDEKELVSVVRVLWRLAIGCRCAIPEGKVGMGILRRFAGFAGFAGICTRRTIFALQRCV